MMFSTTSHQPIRYEIRVKGQLDPKLSAWFEGFTISHTSNGDTLLQGSIVDQAMLHGVLTRCRDLGVTLISINSVEDTIEEKGEEFPMTTVKTAKTIHAEQSAVIDARPEDVYAVIADYRVEHPAILPKPYFTDLVVEKGGYGAGTVTVVKLKMWGKEYTYHQEVTEPEPGRVIVETDIDTGQYSSFTFEPLNGGKQTRLTIASEFPRSRGLAGFLEARMQPAVVARLYKQELDNIAAHLRNKKAQ